MACHSASRSDERQRCAAATCPSAEAGCSAAIADKAIAAAHGAAAAPAGDWAAADGMGAAAARDDDGCAGRDSRLASRGPLAFAAGQPAPNLAARTCRCHYAIWPAGFQGLAGIWASGPSPEASLRTADAALAIDSDRRPASRPASLSLGAARRVAQRLRLLRALTAPSRADSQRQPCPNSNPRCPEMHHWHTQTRFDRLKHRAGSRRELGRPALCTPSTP